MSNKEKILEKLLTIVPNPERWEIKDMHFSYIIYYVTKQSRAISIESHFVLPFLDMDPGA